MKRSSGFTLIEVLVALGIVAIALVAGLQASASLASNAQRQSDVLLAHICAENELVRLKLVQQMPQVGDDERSCNQGGQDFLVRIRVVPTPNPNFRRVDAQVFSNASPVLRLSTIMGRY